MDNIDLEILKHLEKNSRASITELSNKIDIHPQTLYQRLHKIQKKEGILMTLSYSEDFIKEFNLRTFLIKGSFREAIDLDLIHLFETKFEKETLLVFYTNKEVHIIALLKNISLLNDMISFWKDKLDQIEYFDVVLSRNGFSLFKSKHFDYLIELEK